MLNPVNQVPKQPRLVGLFAAISLAVMTCTSAARGQFPIEGFTEPVRRVEVASAEPGVVANVYVHEGDRIAKGQLLAQLENDSLKAAVEVAKTAAGNKGRFEVAQAERTLRRFRVERLELLRTKGHAHQEEILRAQADLEVAEANLRIAEEQQRIDALEWKRAEALLERRNVCSPCDGLVVLVHKEPGEFVASTAPAVVTLVQIDKLRVIFAMSTAEARQVTAWQEVQVSFPDTNSKATAVVESVSPVTDPESGTVRVRVLLDNSKGQHSCGVKCVFGLPTRAVSRK